MKLWLITQHKNKNWDTFDSAVVVAETAEDACKIMPNHCDLSEGTRWINGHWIEFSAEGKLYYPGCGSWTTPEYVRAIYIGETELKEGTVVVSSFIAG